MAFIVGTSRSMLMLTTAVIFVFVQLMAVTAAVEVSPSLRESENESTTVVRNLNTYNPLRVDAMYTYGAPSISNPHVSNPGNKCIPGIRMFTEDKDSDYCAWWDWWCTPSEKITNTDFAAHWNSDDLPHPKMSTLVLIWRDDSQVEYLFKECKDEDGLDEYDFQWWPHYSNDAYVVDNIHSVQWHYERRLQQVPEGVRGPTLEYASIANCAYETTAQGVRDCLDNYSSGGNGLPGIDTSLWEVAAYMNHQYGNGDNDPVVVYENTQEQDVTGNNFKKCIITFSGSESLSGDLSNFLLWNSGTTGYCGRDGVHIGVRNELWQITHDEQWASAIKPQLETCHEIVCVGHSLGGALCNVFTMCANQGEENLDYADDAGMWDDFDVLAWTKASDPSITNPPTKKQKQKDLHN